MNTDEMTMEEFMAQGCQCDECQENRRTGNPMGTKNKGS